MPSINCTGNLLCFDPTSSDRAVHEEFIYKALMITSVVQMSGSTKSLLK